jgi:heptosyltransferase-2
VTLLVVQPRPGIGDLIWHLPLIHALAEQAGGRALLLTKASTGADRLLARDPAIDCLVLDRNPPERRGRHDGPAGFVRLMAQLRASGARSGMMLHHSASLAAAMALAGIRERRGYGYGMQRFWLTGGPTLPAAYARKHPTEQASAYAQALGLPPLADRQEIFVDPAAAASLLAREGRLEGWAVLGVGSTEAARCWAPARFAQLARLLLARGYEGVLLLAASAESALADAVMAAAGDAGPIRRAVGWPLAEVTALLSCAGLFVGNDSGMLNLRVAVGRVAFGLFGVSGPLTYSTRIVPIVSAAGARAGMASIELADALTALERAGVLS